MRPFLRKWYAGRVLCIEFVRSVILSGTESFIVDVLSYGSTVEVALIPY